jgi:hypothetical protein
VAAVVAAHGGRVAVDSEVGRGSTFRITWPAAGGTPTTPRSAGTPDTRRPHTT